MNTFRLPDETHLSRVALRTARLKRMVAFYKEVIGFHVISRSVSEALLSATGRAPALVVLIEESHAKPRPHRATGLYHFAIRYPSRRELAHALLRLTAAKHPVAGALDHGMGESIHVSDPDGNGVELYYDRPRSDWPRRNGRIQLIAEPIDYDSLLATAKGDSLPAHVAEQTDIGHINLHVAELSEAERFFHDFLGFEVMARIPNSATFLAAGGYHHHVAVNTWAGENPAPANSVGLISYRLAVPSAEVMTRLQDSAKPFGYDARTAKDLLQICDPNGHLLELEPQPEEAAAGIRHGINR